MHCLKHSFRISLGARLGAMLRRLAIFFVLITLVVAGAMSHVFGQGSEHQLHNGEATGIDRHDSLELTIPFWVMDRQLQPVSSPSVASAEISVEDEDGTTVRADVFAPEKPLYVVLLLDVSGSMVNDVGDMKDAVADAISSAPDNVHIGLFTFSANVNQIHGFTTDKNAIRNALGRIPTPSGGTCLYDAVYVAADHLGGEDGRRAVLVFTDGKDEQIINDQFVACSTHTLSQAIAQAEQESATVHAIGMKTQRLDSDAVQDLQALGQGTGGGVYTGERADLNSLFSEAISGLGNEYRAVANLIVGEGKHRAMLHVRLDNGASLSEEFSFSSTKDYRPTPTSTPTPVPPTEAPPTPTPVSIGVRVTLLSGQTDYELLINLANAQFVDRLLVQVEVSDGPLAHDEIADVRGRDAFTALIPYAVLRDGQKYVIRVEAFDAADVPVRILDEEESVNSDKPKYTYTLEKPFEHYTPDPPEVSAKVEGVVVDMDSERIFINLEVSDPASIETYNTHLVNSDIGGMIQEMGLEVFPAGGQQISIPMPASFRTQGLGELPLLLTVKLYDEYDNQIELEAYSFVHNHPPRPGMIQRLRRSLTSNYWFAAGLLVVLFILFGWIIAGRTRKRKSLFVESADYTVAEGPVQAQLSDQPNLRIQVLQTPSPGERKAYVVTQFPCRIGRSSSCDLAFPNDTKMSRRHAEITMRDDEFYLTDLGSQNKTSIDGHRLSADSAQRLKDQQTVTFGRDTTVEIKIQYQ